MGISQVWPEWQEDCVLGEGSFGKVYKVKRVEKNRTFFSAVKVLTVPKNSQEIKQARNQGMSEKEVYDYFEGFVDDLLTEIALMENLKSAQNIVQIDDYKILEHQGEIGWDIFIRMELLTPFEDFINDPTFTQVEVVKLGINICTALEVCEQNNIIHRDIKPDNIFVSRFGEYKLGDFGIAKQLDKTQANLSRKGTLNYMAPEVYQGIPYGSSVDIYSLGLVLYSLLNNNRTAFLPPYPQQITYNDNETALTKRLSGEPMPYPCNATPTLGYAVTKACSFRPEDRYQSATEFKKALFAELNNMQPGVHVTVDVNVPAGIPTQPSADFFKHTTNDMTAHGRMLVNEYGEGTTVLNSDMNGLDEGTTILVDIDYNDGTTVLDSTDMKLDQLNEKINDQKSPKALLDNATVPNGNCKRKRNRSSNVCRIIAYPIFGIAILLSLFMPKSETEIGMNYLILCHSFAITGILAFGNKYAIGTALTGISICNLIRKAVYVISLYQSTSDSVNSVSPNVSEIVSLVSGVLVLLAGLSILLQKEVRFGGTMMIYAILALIIADWSASNNIVAMIYSFDINFWSLAFFGVFFWAYGYDSSKRDEGARRIVSYAAYVPAAVTVFLEIYQLYLVL